MSLKTLRKIYINLSFKMYIYINRKENTPHKERNTENTSNTCNCYNIKIIGQNWVQTYKSYQ